MSSNQKPSSSASSSDKSQTKKTICKTKSTGTKPTSTSSTGTKPTSTSSTGSKSSSGSSKSQTTKTISKMKSSGTKPASTSSTDSKSSSGSDKSQTKTICKTKSSGTKTASISSTGPKSSSGTSKSQTTKTICKAKSAGVKSVDGKDGQKVVRNQPNSKATKSSSVRPEPKAVPTLKEEPQDGPENTRETVKQVSSSTTCLTVKVKSNPSKPVTSDKQDGPQSDEDNIDSSLTFMGSKTLFPSYAGVHHSSSKDRYRKANVRTNANPSPPKQMIQAKVNTEETRRFAFEQQIANLMVRLNDPQADATVAAAPTGKQANPTRQKSFGKDGKGNN